MRSKLLVNDVHIGVQRMAGTTPASAATLKLTLHESFRTFIGGHLDKDLWIVGDLFDAFEVDMLDVVTCYFTLTNWLAQSEGDLVLGAGNHDIGKRNDVLSSFGVLARLLSERWPDRVHVVHDALFSVENVHIIPHCMNQDLFNLELEKARHVEPGFLLLHANVDNGFTEHSDHSLNVDAEWLTRLSKIHTLMFAHEHQHRTINYDHHPIHVLGNQWPSSVADCLAHGEAQKDGRKFAHVIPNFGEIMPIETWQRNGDFIQMDWTELKETPERFIRISGKASAAQASDVISAIAKYRTKSSALVITNGVQIDGVKGMDELAEVSFGQIKSFDVLKALYEMLEPAEANAVRELLEVE